MAGTLGDRLKAARLAKNLSVGKLAPRVGLTEAALRHIESGGTKQPMYLPGLKLAYELEINPFYLGFGDESFRSETGSRSAVDVLAALERLLAETAALGRRVSSLEAQVADVLKHRARG